MGNLFRKMAAKRVEKWMLSILPPTFKLINNLIYCKTGLNVGGETRNIAFSTRFAALQNKLPVFVIRFSVALSSPSSL